MPPSYEEVEASLPPLEPLTLLELNVVLVLATIAARNMTDSLPKRDQTSLAMALFLLDPSAKIDPEKLYQDLMVKVARTGKSICVSPDAHTASNDLLKNLDKESQ